MKKRNFIGKKLFYLLCASTIGITLLAGCAKSDSAKEEIVFTEASNATDMYVGKGGTQEGADYYDYVAEEGNTYEEVNGDWDGNTNIETEPGEYTGVNDNRKLIRTVNMEVETEEFELLLSRIEQSIREKGGYIESSYTYNGSEFNRKGKNTKYADMTIRIPDAKLDEFVNGVSGISNVISKNTTAEDVTLQYVDTESKKKMYEAEEESLLELLKKAESVEDITYLTQRLTEVRYRIESMESTLRTYDNLVDYATLNIHINEVEVLTPTEVDQPKTLADRIGEGFTKNLLDVGNGILEFGVGIIISLPYLLLVLAIIGLFVLAIRLIVVIIKKAVAKKRKNKAKTVAQKTVVKAEETENKTQNDTKNDTNSDIKSDIKNDSK